jgi:germination protein M
MKKALPILAIIIIVFGISYIYTNITKDNADNAKVSNDKLNISLYFTNSEKSNLLIEERQIDKVKDNQIVRIVVEELIRGPESQELNATLSPETRLLSVKTEGTVSVVNFSKEFLDFENTADEIIARFSVVNTLCDIKNINKVKILVEENEILDKEGNPVGIIGKDDIVFEARTDKGNMDIKLYFVGSDGEY